MGSEFIQSNLTAGELAPTLHARIDINKYYNGVSNAENMVILPHGGLRRRPGLKKIDDGYIGEEARIEPFVFNTNQKYVLLFRAGFMDVFRDEVKVATDIALPYATIEDIKDFDLVQSADTVFIAHEKYETRIIQRAGDDAIWNVTLLSDMDGYVKPPDFDFGTGTPEPVWSDTRGYPSTVTLHQSRTWLAGSTDKPTTIWGSKINGFFNFDLGTGASDDALADVIDSDQYNKITNIFSGRSLQVFTTGAEFFNSAQVISPAISEWQRQTGYGSKRIRPLLIDGATMYVDSSKRTIRQFLYDYNEGAYVSINLSLLSSHLLTDVRSMSAIKGTQFDVGDYVYAINEDGTCAVLNTMRFEEISGWTHWTTAGTFEDVTVVDKDVYFLVNRDGSHFLERLKEGSYTDHHVIDEGVKPTVGNVIFAGANVTHNNDNVVYTDVTSGTPIREIITNFNQVFANEKFKVVADYSIMEDALYIGEGDLNKFVISRDAYRIEVGLNYKTSVVTLPVATTLEGGGSTLHRRKRLIKVDINVIDSLGVYARKQYTSDRKFVVVLDEAPKRFTGFKEMYLLGYDRLTTIEIHQDEPLPFVLISLGLEVGY